MYLVFTGRPNAGKSSIIKEVAGLNVQIGKHPGTTRSIKEYALSNDLMLIDMPGFGKIMGASKHFEGKKNDQIIKFLESHARDIALAVHVLDISTFSEVTSRLGKKGFISVDVEMVQFLTDILGEPPLVAANKTDKADREELEINLEEFIRQIGKSHQFTVGEQVFPVSAKTKDGMGALKDSIHKRLVAKGYRTPFKMGL